MTTYQTHELFTEILEGAPIPIEKLQYFRTRFQLEVYNLIASRFVQQEISQADYARRIHRTPEVISRVLANPSNLTLDTLTDFLIGLGLLPIITDERVADRFRSAASNPSRPLGLIAQGQSATSTQPMRTIPQPSGTKETSQGDNRQRSLP